MNKITQAISKTNHRQQSTPQDTETYQGEMRSGMSAEAKESDIKPSDQMAETSNVSQKKIFHYPISTIQKENTQIVKSSNTLIIPKLMPYTYAISKNLFERAIHTSIATLRSGLKSMLCN